MFKIIATLTRIFSPGLLKVSSSIFALLLTVVSAYSQSSTDGTTPPALTPGAPAGSYPLSGFESVNLFNGNLDLHLPLLNIGGRGNARTGLMLNIQERWRVEQADGFSHPTYNWWSRIELGYGPGFMDFRYVTEGDTSCETNPLNTYKSLLRFTFTMPDGTEIELRDRLTGGAPLDQNTCLGGSGPTRGRAFVTSDGTSATYILDNEVFDLSFGDLSGVLILKDGTRYDINLAGLVKNIRDPNGNKVTFKYDALRRVDRITDSLNRVVNLVYGRDIAPYGLHDEITFTGFNNAPRIIRVSKKKLRHAFPPGSSYERRTPHHLFPQLSGASDNPVNAVDPEVTTAAWLPDGRAYKFFYNEYAELARVELPTGGAIEYKWAAGVQGAPSSGVLFGEIYRRVIERRLYPDGGTGYPDNDATDPYQLKTAYGKQEQLAAGGSSTTDLGFVQVTQLGTGGVLLAQSKHYFHGYASSPTGNPLSPLPGSPIYYVPWRFGKENKTESLSATGTVWQRARHTWAQGQPAPAWWAAWAFTNELHPVNDAPSSDPHITETKTELTDFIPNLIAKQMFEYDQFNNRTAVTEFDYKSGVDPTVAVRRTETTFVTTEGQLNYTSDNIHIKGLPKRIKVFGYNEAGVINPSRTAETEFYYDEFTLADCPGVIGWTDPGTAARGNLTTTKQWLSAPDNWITTSQKYSKVGSVIESTDGRGNTSLITYSDASSAYAFPSKTQTPPVNINGTPQRLDTNYAYDFSSGLITSMTEPNGFVTTYDYADPLDRLTKVTRPTGGGQTEYFYGDTIGSLFLRTRTSLDSSRSLENHQYFDGLGRPKRSFTSEGEGYIVTDTEHDGLGRTLRVSNPYRTLILNDPSINPSGKWTTYAYDPLGRSKTVTTHDQAVVTTDYDRNEVKVTDQAGKKQNSTSDALGRLIKVVEDPSGLNYSTTYSYDVLDNLLEVKQGPSPGAQTRTFTYDPISRLKTASNPEYNAGTFYSYTYDANSNLFTRTDPRGAVTTYTYDSLNRVTKREYSSVAGVSATPTVNYKYDTATNGKGMPAEVTYGAGIDGFFYGGYDQMGRLTSSSQKTDGQGYAFSYAYDLAGNLTSQTYPSGKIVATEYDAAGRIAGVKEGTHYYAGAPASDASNRIQYAPHGRIENLRLGNGLWEHTAFNDRLQPEEIWLGINNQDWSTLKLAYTYSTPSIKNNGNVLTQTVTAPKTTGGNLVLTQGYGYDGANRLSSVEENPSAVVWRQKFSYDRFGNRTIDTTQSFPSEVISSNVSISPATNRITTSNYAYDNAGNLTAEPGKTYIYDAENRLTSLNQGAALYVYDGDGRRVKKTVGSVATVMVYNAQGQLIAEYGGQAITQAATNYLTTDHLGSTRVVTDQSKTVKARYDYLPFGEESIASLSGRGTVTGYVNTNKTRQKFTGYERDNESELDYALARYYSNKQGRFTSTDAPFAGQSEQDPQSWNLFVYARNNPLMYVDPTGRDYDFYDDKNNLKGRVKDAEELVNQGYKFTGSDNDGRTLYFEGGYTARYFKNDPGAIVNVYGGFSDLTPFANGVIKELDRRAAPSLQAIEIASDITLTPITIISGTAVFRGGIMTLGFLGPIRPPAGDKISQMVARYASIGGQKSYRAFMAHISELITKAVERGTYVQTNYMEAGSTIFKLGDEYITVSRSGRMISYVAKGEDGWGVVSAYRAAGGK